MTNCRHPPSRLPPPRDRTTVVVVSQFRLIPRFALMGLRSSRRRPGRVRRGYGICVSCLDEALRRFKVFNRERSTLNKPPMPRLSNEGPAWGLTLNEGTDHG